MRFIIIYILLCKCNFDFVKQMSMVKKTKLLLFKFYYHLYKNIKIVFFKVLRLTRNRCYTRIIIIEDVNVYYLFEYSVLFCKVLKYDFLICITTLNKITFYHNIFLDFERSDGCIDRTMCVGVFFIFFILSSFFETVKILKY